MVVALLALFVALSGTGYAAIKINGTQLTNRSVAAKKIRKNTLTGREIRESRLGTVPRARNTTRLGGRDSSGFLASNATAADSSQLGGLGPSSYVRRECDQNSGQIKGFAAVDAATGFSGTFTVVPGYNCSGQSVEARRLSLGRYEVRFNGSPVTRGVATSLVPGFSADMVSLTNEGPGLFLVYILDPVPSPGAFVDHAFTMITP
jgi:hypothetical protein